MSFLDELRDSIERIKRKLGISWQKLLDQIPDSDRLDSYRYDELTKTWVLQSELPVSEIPILDENRNLKVETPNFKIYEGVASYFLGTDIHLNVDLNFLADSVAIYFYDVVPGDNFFFLYYSIDGTLGLEIEATALGNTSINEEEIRHFDLIPFNSFIIRSTGLNLADFKWKAIFSKQKKTKISDLIYNATNWNAIVDIGASKNTIRDKIEAMVLEYVALISDVVYDSTTWNGVTTIAPSKNAIRDKIELLVALISANCTIAEVEAVITAELVNGQSIDLAIDSLIAIHHLSTSTDHDDRYYTETEVNSLTWLEEDITDLDHDDVDAIHDNVASEITTITEKSVGVANDEFVIEDSADSNNKKSIKMNGLRLTESQITDLDHDDIDAIHDNVASEISAITEKTALVDNDMFLLEDSEASNIKKMVKKSNLPGGYTQAEVDTLLHIGIANKGWKNCILEGETADNVVNSFDAYRNIGAVNMNLLFGIPLDYIIGTHNLVITQFKIGISDSDANDYVDRIRLFGWSAYGTGATLVDIDHNAVHGTGVGEFTNDHADQTIGGIYERILFLVSCINIDALGLDITYIKVEYYYA